jgi:hypothetical protein
MMNDMFNLLQLETIATRPGKPYKRYQRRRSSRRSSRTAPKARQENKKQHPPNGDDERGIELDLDQKGDWEQIYPLDKTTKDLSERLAATYDPRLPEVKNISIS